MIYYIIFSLILAVCYVILMCRYTWDWERLPAWKMDKPISDFRDISSNYQLPTTNKIGLLVSILVPARNEANGILECLNAIRSQNFPTNLYEIIVIDDYSDDKTIEVVLGARIPNLRLLELKNCQDGKDASSAFKKRAIGYAISESRGSLIVTTDADCVMGPDWLALLVSYYLTHKPKLIAAPVNFYKEKNAFERFQSLDFAGMMGVTGAGIQGGYAHLCNGANLAYEKQAFYEVGGFEGIDSLASGDDMMLMQKIGSLYPHKIGFVKNKDALVHTHAKPDLSSFTQQRLRWASKSSSYQQWGVTVQLAIAYLFCVVILIWLLVIGYWLLVLSQLSTTNYQLYFGITTICILAKSCIDYYFLNKMASFFDRKDLLKKYWLSQLMHIAYIVFIGTLANLVKKYHWKGRSVG
jgi:cellulose synthase/poly-beta-1,6-N-acetylglucosamine synthase-like glycosyltransferase